VETTAKIKKSGSLMLIALCWLVYACSYIGKLSYSANINQIEGFYGVSHANAGSVSTFCFFAYGAGQIFNGLFCKKYNLKYVIFGALLVCATCNFIIFLLPTFNILRVAWLLNGGALSVLWPSLMRLLSETLPRKRISTSVVAMGTTVATGTFFVYGMSALFVKIGVFKITFLVASILLPVISLIWLMAFNKLTERSKAEAKLEKEEIEKPTKNTQTQNVNENVHTLLVVLAVFAVVTNLVKDGLTTWVPTILKELYVLPPSLSILLTLFLPILGIFGTVVAVNLRKVFNNFITLCSIIFSATTLLILFVILFMNSGAVLPLVSFALVSCLMASTNNIITSMVPLNLKTKSGSGLIAGVLNGFCYLGSTLSSYGLGLVADFKGWGGVFTLLFITCAVCVVIGIVSRILTLKFNKNK